MVPLLVLFKFRIFLPRTVCHLRLRYVKTFLVEIFQIKVLVSIEVFIQIE